MFVPAILRPLSIIGFLIPAGALLASQPSWAAAATGSPALARDPAATSTDIFFVARGELWRVSLSGGTAQRLTFLDGEIERPRISPDGRFVAFALLRNGVSDLYVLPVEGGTPRRLTFLNGEGLDDEFPLVWTPDSSHVLFLTSRFSWSHKIDRPFSVGVTGGLPEPFGLDHSGSLAFAPDGKTLVLTRFLTDLWSRKRYLGGQAPALFLQNLRGGAARRLTTWSGTSTDPMWLDARTILFVSDQGSNVRLNLWSLDLPTRQFRQITRFSDGDIDGASISTAGIVVFEQGGRLWRLAPRTGELHPISVSVPDDGARTAPHTVDAAGAARPTDVTGRPNYAVLPGGDLVLPARGGLFRISTAATGAKASILASTPGADADHPAVSPDGRTLAFLRDGGDRTVLVLRPLAPPASGQPDTGRQIILPVGSTVFTPIWSPDGARLALPDAQHRLWLVSVAKGAVRLVAMDPRDAIRDPAFSPDGHWLAFSTMTGARLHQLHLYATEPGQDRVLADPLEDNHLPAFTPDGKRLLFASARRAVPLRSDRDDEQIASLAADVLCVLQLPSGTPTPVLAGNLSVVPLPPTRIIALATRGDAVFVETRPPELIGGELPDPAATLYRLDPATLAPAAILHDFDDAAIAADGSALGFHRNGDWYTSRSFRSDGTADAHRLVPPALPVVVDPRIDWAGEFERAWRLDRDVFLSRDMNGNDWNAIHDAYRRYLPLLGSNGDMFWLLRQLQGELATSHAFIEPAEPDAPAVPTPLLGADLLPDRATDTVRLSHILRGDPTRSRFRAPLGGTDLADGAVLRAINGHPLNAGTDPFAVLAASRGSVTLTVADGPDGPARKLSVKPVTYEGALRQLDHEQAARARVAALSHGGIGYVFLSDFYSHGTEDFWRQYDGQRNKDGLVIDIRWNAGGDTSQFVLDQLRRPSAGGFVNREGGFEPLPAESPRFLELLDNAATASDGDQFAFFFQSQHLGEVIGQRTWGGVQGINAPWPLADGTGLLIPKDALAGPGGRWIIENAGASPDLEADDQPLEGSKREGEDGADTQLDVATRRLLGRLASAPPTPRLIPPALPAYPANGNVPGAHFQ